MALRALAVHSNRLLKRRPEWPRERKCDVLFFRGALGKQPSSRSHRSNFVFWHPAITEKTRQTSVLVFPLGRFISPSSDMVGLDGQADQDEDDACADDMASHAPPRSSATTSTLVTPR